MLRLRISLLLAILASAVSFIEAFSIQSPDLSDLPEDRSLIRPIIVQQQDRNDVQLESSLNSKDNSHLDRLSINLPASDSSSEMILDLELNRGLLPADDHTEIPLSHYRGTVRGSIGSWVALSTYDGLRGVIFDGHESYSLEPAPKSSLLTHDHILVKYPNSENMNSLGLKYPVSEDRAIDNTVEILVVVDNTIYKNLGSDVTRTTNRVRDIYNIVNQLYNPLGISIAVSEVVIWTTGNQINIGSNANFNLRTFDFYRRFALGSKTSDTTHLVIGVGQNGIGGLAGVGSMCSPTSTALIVHDQSYIYAAAIVAHEMGHSFGLSHDDANPARKCKCPKGQGNCLEGGAAGTNPSKWGWSDCSQADFNQFVRVEKRYPCIKNAPVKNVLG